MKQDFVGALKQVAKIGYAGIEGGGTGPLSLADYKKLLKDLNLIPASAGAGVDALLGERSEEFATYCRELGIGLAMIGYFTCDTAAGWKEFAGKLTQAGKVAKAAGVALQYHNHAHEFKKYDGKAALDIVFENVDREFVRPQLDVGWVKRAGEDPVAWMKKFADRKLRTIHVKDTTAPPDPKWVEVGNGILPLDAVLKTAKELGIEWYIVEQDDWQRPSLEAAAISFENLKKALGE